MGADERDNTTQPCCAICGKVIRGTAWTCLECEAEWGLAGSLKPWPKWARFLKAEEAARRRKIALELAIDNLASVG